MEPAMRPNTSSDTREIVLRVGDREKPKAISTEGDFVLHTDGYIVGPDVPLGSLVDAIKADREADRRTLSMGSLSEPTEQETQASSPPAEQLAEEAYGE
jgi:hypothetical protein